MTPSARQRAAALFLDKVEADGYFDAKSAERVRVTIEKILQEPERVPLFLLGNPGAGKTQMLRTLTKKRREKGWTVLRFDDPFYERDLFLARLAEGVGIDPAQSVPNIEILAEHYGERDHLIMCDEAQLMDDKVLETVRMLSDTGAFRFVMAMHKAEGEALLSRPHFRSRTHKVVELGALEEVEIARYIRYRLEAIDAGDLFASFGKGDIRTLHRKTGGNFRLVKRMLHAAFTLMDEADRRGYERLAGPCGTIWCMAALETGVEDG